MPEPAVGDDYLECGHRLLGAYDIYGARYPARRRCFKCAADKPQDFDPRQPIGYTTAQENRP